MSALELKAYKELNEKFGESIASTLLQLVEEKAIEKTSLQKEVFATKDDLKKIEADVRKEDTRLEVTLKTEIARLENRIVVLDSKFESKFSEFESKITKQLYWMNILQLLAIIGSVMAIFRFMSK